MHICFVALIWPFYSCLSSSLPESRSYTLQLWSFYFPSSVDSSCNQHNMQHDPIINNLQWWKMSARTPSILAYRGTRRKKWVQSLSLHGIRAKKSWKMKSLTYLQRAHELVSNSHEKKTLRSSICEVDGIHTIQTISRRYAVVECWLKC